MRCEKCKQKIKVRRNYPFGRNSKCVYTRICNCGIDKCKIKQKNDRRRKRGLF